MSNRTQGKRMDLIRLLLVDDHVLFRQSLARLLASEPGFEVAADCVITDEALDVLRARDIDIVLLDFDLGNEDGVRFIDASRRIRPDAKILMVTAGMSPGQSSTALRLGVSGIFLKHGSPVALLQAIRLVDSGAMWVDRGVVLKLVAQADAPPTPDRPQLSDREQRVLQGVFEGLANKEISSRLGVSESAVKSTLQQLFRKARVRTRSQLVRFALETSPTNSNQH
jgi:DNA-binding NarL/FixJ family response regulator